MLSIDKEYFNIEDTLKFGQAFSFEQYDKGYIVRSRDKFAYVYCEQEKIVIKTEHKDYFYNYFDLAKNYEQIIQRAKSFNIDLLNQASNLGKGIRILRQDPYEMIISFLISQNNNISRITKSIFYLCEKLGDRVDFLGTRYTFPSPYALANASQELLKNAGLGYRCEYVKNTAQMMLNGKLDINYLSSLPTSELKRELLKVKGIGDKVANCITLFGFYRLDSFPVDTWIEKVYLTDFKGESTSREKMTEYFIDKFGLDSGIIQQYLFHYKRNIQGRKI